MHQSSEGVSFITGRDNHAVPALAGFAWFIRDNDDIYPCYEKGEARREESY